MSDNLYKALCARLLLVDFTERINLCCLCLETVGEKGASVDDEVVLNLQFGLPQQSHKLSNILKSLLDDNFSEVMYILKSVCKQCMSSAVTGYKFIQRCKHNAKKLTKVIENLEESLDELLPNDKINCKSLYIAIQPCNNSTTVVKRYYDIRQQLIPEDTAFLRFSQIVESQKQLPEAIQDHTDGAHESDTDQTIQALMCCETEVDTKELLDNPTKPYEFKCKFCKQLFAKSTSLRVHFFRVHRRKEFKCVKCKTANDTQAKVVKQKQPQIKDKLQNSTQTCSSDRIVEINEDPLEFCNTGEPNEEDDHRYNEQINSKSEEENQNVIKLVSAKLLLQNKSCEIVQSSVSLHDEAPYIIENNTETDTDNQCNNCGMKFSTRTRYLTHIKKFKSKNCTRYKGRGEFICAICNYTAFYKHVLSMHIRFKHLGEKGHVCSYCDKNCYSQSELELHLRKHTGEKPFICQECGSKFSIASNLKHHKYLHTGERPYKCEFCNKEFRTGTSLGEHVTRLHKPRTLKCNICGRLLKHNKDLVRHKIRHHSLESQKKNE